jgi:gas vesicle protein
MDRNPLTMIPWFLTGVLTGTVAALLLAPRSGSDTRRRVVERGIDAAEGLIGEERVEQGRRTLRRGQEIRELARDAADVARRARRVIRPLDQEGDGGDKGEES